MKTVQRFFIAHLLVAVAALAIGFSLAGYRAVSLTGVFLGMVWFAARQRNAPGMEGMILAIFLISGGIGMIYDVSGWLMLLMAVASLGAWDLDHFLQRLSEVEQVEFESGIGREHIRRLLMVEGLGFLAGLLALTTRLGIPFWWEALLVLLAVLALRGLVAFVRKQTER